jgi:hypothetical protein
MFRKQFTLIVFINYNKGHSDINKNSGINLGSGHFTDGTLTLIYIYIKISFVYFFFYSFFRDSFLILAFISKSLIRIFIQIYFKGHPYLYLIIFGQLKHVYINKVLRFTHVPIQGQGNTIQVISF